MTCETIKVQADNEEGFKIINKDDFNDKEHKLYEAPKKRSTKKEG